MVTIGEIKGHKVWLDFTIGAVYNYEKLSGKKFFKAFAESNPQELLRIYMSLVMLDGKQDFYTFNEILDSEELRAALLENIGVEHVSEVLSDPYSRKAQNYKTSNQMYTGNELVGLAVKSGFTMDEAMKLEFFKLSEYFGGTVKKEKRKIKPSELQRMISDG